MGAGMEDRNGGSRRGGGTAGAGSGGGDRAAGKRFAPAAERNAGPIAGRLAERLPRRGRVLEVASGTGQHVVAFARRFPGIRWTPSDPDPAARASIAARIAESGLGNVAAPCDVDVTRPGWEDAFVPPPGASGWDALVAINLLHISPWTATEGLLAGAGRLLAPSGRLFVYGCFRRGGRHLSARNAEFDRSLRARDPRWGVRDVEEVARAAGRHGLLLDETLAMPANNLMLVLVPG